MKRLCWLLLLCCLTLGLPVRCQDDVWLAPVGTTDQTVINDILKQVNNNYARIKDAKTDLTMDVTLHLFGCSGLQRYEGSGFFKAPDRIKTTLNKVTYFARGNRIRKIDEQGKRWYVKLLNAVDFTPGFNIDLIPYNFELSLVSRDSNDIVLLGMPKAGRLKNIKKVYFHIDPKLFLLRSLDLVLVNENLNGSITIEHEKIKGIWVPVGFRGQSAIELKMGILVGMDISLKARNMKINTGLPDKLFEPGF